MGAEVIAISHSPSKKDLCMNELGAQGFLNTSDKAAMKKERKTFDLLLNTVSASIEFDPLLALLKSGGALRTVGVPPAPGTLAFNGNRLMAGISVHGSLIGAPAEIAEMLDFCIKHKISAMTEVVPFSQTHAAVERVRQGLPRFRIVLEMPTGIAPVSKL
jgi:D-arabinose 1-dehydrogenase-like Zn-dependent alcohol dehydrogenase